MSRIRFRQRAMLHPIEKQTFIQEMYARWHIMSAIETTWRELKAMPISRLSFDRPVPVKNGEQVSIQFEFEVKEPKEGNFMFGYYNPPPSQPEIVCPCCKGSGTFTLFTTTEPCGECKGTGKVKGKPVDQPGAKGSADIDYGALGL